MLSFFFFCFQSYTQLGIYHELLVCLFLRNFIKEHGKYNRLNVLPWTTPVVYQDKYCITQFSSVTT